MNEQRKAEVRPPEVATRDGSPESDRTRVDPEAVHASAAFVSPPLGESRRTSPPKPSAPTVALPEGFRLLEYRIDGVLGQGGFGIAYRATDVNLNAKVVIKEYLPEEIAYRAADYTVGACDEAQRELYQTGLENFLVEARTLATFRHPRIVRVARFFEANQTAYMVLEYERGESLKSWRRKHENVAEPALVALLAPLLDGLAVVHRAGYLHRDIKPDNIYVRDADGSLVLLDFGAARQTASEKTHFGTVVTPGYGPIEQYADVGRQGPWTDIYSLGATVFWLITGRRPIDAPSRLAEPDPLPSARELCKGRYSVEFLSAIDWALKRHPDDRPQDVAEFRSALFAAHPALLGLQEALRAGDEERDATAGLGERWAIAHSPRNWKGRLTTVARALRRPASWPLAVKMTLAMLITALAPMMITAYYNFNATLNHVAAVELQNLEQLAASTAGRLAQLISDNQKLAAYLSADEDFVSYLSKPTPTVNSALVAKLNALANANPDVQFAMLMDNAGTVVAASDPGLMGKNFKGREYFRRAMQGSAHTTGITVGKEASTAGVFHSHPVFAHDGKTVIGALALRMKAEPIARILADTQAGENRLAFLVDGESILIWHPDEKLRFASLVPLRKETLEAMLSDQRFGREKIDSLGEPQLAQAMVGAKQGGHVSYHSSTSRRDEIAGFAPVPGQDWVVGVSESRDYFAAPLSKLLENVLYSVLAAGAVFLLIAMFFARSIVHPIERLTAAAHALKSGDYANANVAARTDDEIGQLVRTFNVMIDVLRQRQRERERDGRRAATHGDPDEER